MSPEDQLVIVATVILTISIALYLTSAIPAILGGIVTAVAYIVFSDE